MLIGFCFVWKVFMWGYLFRIVEIWGGKIWMEEVGYRRWVFGVILFMSVLCFVGCFFC